MKVCILTSSKPRHIYMINLMARKFDVVGVFCQKKSVKRMADTKAELTNMEGKEEIIKYMDEFKDTEKKHFYPLGEKLLLDDKIPVYHVEPGKINNAEWVEKIRAINPDCFAVYGTGLIKEELLSFPQPYINIHLGLSPYYRGMATTFWPYHSKEPEYVGVTVMHLDIGIDSGPIIHQSLVDLEPGDTIHDGSMKAIRAGVDLQLKAIEEFGNQTIKSYEQDLSIGRTYYNDAFNAHVLREVQQYWNETNLSDYIKNQDNLKSKINYIK